MCGICGYVGHPEGDDPLKVMVSVLKHRGPDDKGVYTQPGVALGHTRLSIIDLATGHQPIHNENKSVWVVYNGEIYNYRELREELIKKGHKFYTRSDTEVIVHLYEDEGEYFVKRLNGEFAIAIWDVPRQRLILARDRLGIRPLYYYSKGDLFLFGSEIKALLATGLVDKQLNHTALDNYITLRYVLGNDTLFKGVRRLPAGSIMVYQKNGFNISSYWELNYEPKMRSHRDVEEGFCSLLEDSVERRMMSEVPLGAFLSGGLDSSVIVALMARYTNKPVKTFCVGFGTDIDELDEARNIADYLGCDHQELITGKQDYMLLPRIVRQMDEPLGDAIIIPTYLLAQATAQKVKVVLTGEGADEVLGGYIHQLTMNLGGRYNSIVPEFLQNINLALLRAIPLGMLESFFPYPAQLGIKGKTKLINYLSHLKSDSQAYLDLTSLFSSQEKEKLFTPDFLNDTANERTIEKELELYLSGKDISPSLLDKVIEFDRNNWLPNYTLFKQDRLTMAHSLEGRVPFLDHRLVEFCAQAPATLKLHGLTTTKYLLRKAAERFLPKKTAWAKKKSFYMPTEKCFDGKFHDFIRDVLNPRTIKNRGIFNWEYVKRFLQPAEGLEFLDNKRLMAILILELWFTGCMDGPASAASSTKDSLETRTI